jgi:hypothetical protein
MSVHDIATLAEAFAKPGMDPRQWCSYATVDRETPDQKSVQFTDEYGPLVSCTLHPSGIPVVCRVAHEVAGNGEGEWTPFVAGDEVIVLIPEGDESAGCVIVGRLNQEIDAWPKTVAGQDATANNFGFRRMRFPYVIETAASYLIRHATTGAFLGINGEGVVTIANADNAFLALTASLLGLQNGDADVLMQIDVGAKQVVLEAVGTKLSLDGAASTFISSGTLNVGTSGLQGSGHAITLEQVLGLISNVIAYLAGVSAFDMGSPFGASWSMNAPAPLATLWSAVIPASVSPSPISASPGGILDPLALPPLILEALASQLPDPAAFGLPAPVIPGLARPGFLY